MTLHRDIDRLREAVAVNLGSRPTWVMLAYVTNAFILRDRIDVVFRWVHEDRECIVHTNARTERGAISEVRRVAEHVAPGLRFRADNPTLVDRR